MDSLDCKILTSDVEIDALADEWRGLHERAGTSLFTDYEWFRIWWQTIGNNGGRTLHIVAGWRDGKLVGLLPLAVIVRKGFRVLQAIGAEAFYYCDMMCENAADAAELWKTARQSPHYDFAHLRDVAPGSACESTLSSFAHLRDRSKAISLRIAWKTGEEWQATLPHELRRTINRRRRRLEEQGAISYEMCHGEPVPAGIIEDMVKLKTQWCRERGLEGMFDQPDILSFYKHMAQQAAQNKTLVLAWVKCGDAIIAYNLMYRYKKTLHSFVLATDPAWLKYSPGNLAHVYGISWAVENGFDEFDLMQGEFAYKYQFANHERECREYTFSRSPKGWLGEQLFIKRRMIKRRMAKKNKA